MITFALHQISQKMSPNKNYLNIGCGKKFHKSWENVDMVSHSKYVRQYNLIKGLPYPNNTFDVVYHSQVLEHIPKEDALSFIQECYRVLKPNGVIRVVVPNLENIIDEYRRLLSENIENPTEVSNASYDWIMLELFDQVLRNQSGGQMRQVLSQSNLVHQEYINTRRGFIGRQIQNKDKVNETLKTKITRVIEENGLLGFMRLSFGLVKQKVFKLLLGKKYSLGDFRLGGEIHYWMYDKFSLKRLLESAAFQDVKLQTPHDSDIPEWANYELDVKDNQIYDPTSLFMEARKIN